MGSTCWPVAIRAGLPLRGRRYQQRFDKRFMLVCAIIIGAAFLLSPCKSHAADGNEAAETQAHASTHTTDATEAAALRR